jgi:hypothetical protein
MISATGYLNEAKAAKRAAVPDARSFRDYLLASARVPLRDGSYGAFSFEGRAPLEFIVGLIDKVIANCLQGKTVEVDGVKFGPGKLKGTTISVGGGAQFGKTVLVLNFQGFATFIKFVNFGYYTPDQELLAKIVDTKFRPDVLDQNPWMSQMVQIGKAENASGKSVNRKNSYQASDGERKAFGHFCGMQKPPTTISLDAAALDEVDDIPARNMGYVDGRMTGSRLQLKCEIGTQRIAGAGQNARLKAGSFHVRMYDCPKCGKSWNLEEEFPRIIRKRLAGGEVTSRGAREHSSRRALQDTSITPEMGHDRNAEYCCACPECGAELDRNGGRYVAKNPRKIADAHFSVRVSQLNISAISLQEIVGAWYGAMADPSGDALVAFYCDRVAIPNAGAAQPITQRVLDDCRALGLGENPEAAQPYAMSLSRVGDEARSRGTPEVVPYSRFAGMDTGPRCWFWCDEVRSEQVSACVWAELIASGNTTTRVPWLMERLGVRCLFIDAGGEPDLTKRLVLSLNGLEHYTPPVRSKNDLIRSKFTNLGVGVSWDGARGRWSGIRAAAVLFVAGEGKGIEQTIGFTQEGRIYPLMKCNRGESIQTAVNDFLTPADGVLELVAASRQSAAIDSPENSAALSRDAATAKAMRTLPRARLPQTYIGAGVSQAILDGHLLNLRKERDTKSGKEDWVDQVENHLGLAKTYARLAAIAGNRKPMKVVFAKPGGIPSQRHVGKLGLGSLRTATKSIRHSSL